MTDFPKKLVTITIAARPCSGKTTIALLIEDVLKKAGFEVEFNNMLEVPGFLEGEPATNIEECSPEVLKSIRAKVLEPNSARVRANAEKTRIEIKQRQKKRKE